MTVCPIAIASGCKQCFAFSYCPLKSIFGDFELEKAATDEETASEKSERSGDQ